MAKLTPRTADASLYFQLELIERTVAVQARLDADQDRLGADYGPLHDAIGAERFRLIEQVGQTRVRTAQGLADKIKGITVTVH